MDVVPNVFKQKVVGRVTVFHFTSPFLLLLDCLIHSTSDLFVALASLTGIPNKTHLTVARREKVQIRRRQ